MSDFRVSIKIDKDIFSKEEWEELGKRVVKTAMHKAKSFWKTEAGLRLDSTRANYQKSIHIRGNTIYLQHDNPTINKVLMRLENGTPTQIDLKPNLLKNQLYRVIPLNRDNPAKPLTFRTVSVNSPSKSWMWPKSPSGKMGAGVKIHEDVLRELETYIIYDELTEVLKEKK